MSDDERAADDAAREAAEAGVESAEASEAADRVRDAAAALQGAGNDAERDALTREFVQAAGEAVREAREAEREAGEATAAVQHAGDVAVAAAAEAGAGDDPLLDTAIRQIEAGATEDQPFGTPGKPFAPRSPFRVAFVATWGVLAALVVFAAIWNVRDVVILLVVSAFLAIGLNPAVEFLQRRGLKRGVAVGSIIGLVLLFFAGFVAAAAPPVTRQATQLQERIPEYAERLRANDTFRRLDNEYDITPKLNDWVAERSGEVASGALGAATAILAIIFKTLTILVLTLYFLGAYQRIKHGAYRMLPRSRRARAGLIGDEILSRVGGYVLGNLATSFIAGVLALVFFLAAGVPYPVALAMLVALLDLIPLIGATIAAVVCTAVAFFVSVPVGVATAIYFVIYQQVENYVLVPKVMKRTVDISPLATIVAALIGGSLLGVLGALLAIPVAAAIQLIGTEVLYPRQDAS